jgi:hypothetical protein
MLKVHILETCSHCNGEAYQSTSKRLPVFREHYIESSVRFSLG